MRRILWKMVPMTNYLSDIKGAIQLNHAMDDTVVDIGYSRDLQALLDKTNIPHELHEYSSGGHNISGSSFAQAMQNTVSFFKNIYSVLQSPHALLWENSKVRFACFCLYCKFNSRRSDGWKNISLGKNIWIPAELKRCNFFISASFYY